VWLRPYPRESKPFLPQILFGLLPPSFHPIKWTTLVMLSYSFSILALEHFSLPALHFAWATFFRVKSFPFIFSSNFSWSVPRGSPPPTRFFSLPAASFSLCQSTPPIDIDSLSPESGTGLLVNFTHSAFLSFFLAIFLHPYFFQLLPFRSPFFLHLC